MPGAWSAIGWRNTVVWQEASRDIASALRGYDAVSGPGIDDADAGAFEIAHVPRHDDGSGRTRYGRDLAIGLANGPARLATGRSDLTVGSGCTALER